jgi:ATP-dependent RNA helicase DHX36
LLLFGGKIKVEHEKFRASCDNWIKFRAAPRVAVLFKSLREELEDVLLRKIADPGLNVVRESEGLVDTIVEVLESEHATNTSNTTTAKDEDVDENAEKKREY